MSKVALLFLQKRMGGGTTTFTAQLAGALNSVGHDAAVIRVGKYTAQEPEPFGEFEDITERTYSAEDMLAIVKHVPSVIVAPTSMDNLMIPDLIPRLLKLGSRVVLHDSTQLHLYTAAKNGKPRFAKAPICVRETMLERAKNGVHIPHPYNRVHSQLHNKIRIHRHAVSVARVHNTKRSSLILKANELLTLRDQVKLMGKEFRLYSYGLAKRYKSFKQSNHGLTFPLTFTAPVEICTAASYNVDMTFFKDDGGGTQYSQLEAMDGRCCNIMHADWFRYPGELKKDKHAIAVKDFKELASVLEKGDIARRQAVVANCEKLLKRHTWKIIGKRYAEELGL